MSGRWKFFIESRPWDQSQFLFAIVEDLDRKRGIVRVLFEALEPRQYVGEPTLKESAEEHADGLGDVTGFLQAALDCAWEQGMRPKAYADHTNELAAVRYHLEDMRGLARVPPRSKL